MKDEISFDAAVVSESDTPAGPCSAMDAPSGTLALWHFDDASADLVSLTIQAAGIVNGDSPCREIGVDLDAWQLEQLEALCAKYRKRLLAGAIHTANVSSGDMGGF